MIASRSVAAAKNTGNIAMRTASFKALLTKPLDFDIGICPFASSLTDSGVIEICGF